tara:strand:- start:23548 stop:24519 length:972 start_codon:yes stop_codon:yes gene_type:complete
MKLLITGGAGYIGSHMVRYAQECGHEVTVLDDFSTGHLNMIKNCEIYNVNLLDQEKLSIFFKDRYFDVVIHFAAKSLVEESIKKPELYYSNNVSGSLNLVKEMISNGVSNLVFSSTAAIFGNPVTDKIAEDHPMDPINPYGKSKLIVENILENICSAYDFNVTCLRYFNAAGAHDSGEIGEDHDPETHLIPNVLKSVIEKKIILKVFGNDYTSIDGTCVRDYVHVTDLAQAHLLSHDYMTKKKGFSTFNLGNGDGFSVLDVIKGCEKVVESQISYKFSSRRDGDPAILVADSTKAIKELGWKPKFSKLETIIKSAWRWHARKM